MDSGRLLAYLGYFESHLRLGNDCQLLLVGVARFSSLKSFTYPFLPSLLWGEGVGRFSGSWVFPCTTLVLVTQISSGLATSPFNPLATLPSLSGACSF